MPNFNFNTAAKQICDGFIMGVSKHFISIALQIGQNVVAISLPPEGARDFAEAMKKTIEEYERQFGKMPETNKPVPSPIDLSKPEK